MIAKSTHLESILNTIQYLTSLPSYVVGSIRQTLATLDKNADFQPVDKRPIILIPGAFCTPSVMNNLGRHIEKRGRSVALAPAFPFYFSAFANLCRLQKAADIFSDWLTAYCRTAGCDKVDVAAHSNGGLIVLLSQAVHGKINRMVTMATPFNGFPGALPLSVLLPCCRDLTSNAAALDQAKKASDMVVRCLVSERDSLIPPSRQYLDQQRQTVMEGFQHMDYIVGSEEKIARTAWEVVRWLECES